jgi:RNA ligase
MYDIIEFPKETDREAGFIVKDVTVHGEECLLIFAGPNAVWNEKNKFFRSSLWTKKDKRLISAGWRKFTNLGEQPEFEPLEFEPLKSPDIDISVDKKDGAVEFIQKLDGSLLIISKFKNNLICRTRGSIDVKDLENGWELEILKEKYPLAFNNEVVNSEEYTILCEWTTPTNVIVLRETDEPTLWLLGIVSHKDYSYLPQPEIDELAKAWGLNRPKRFQFTTPEEMKERVKDFKNCEGIVIYSQNWQVLKKVKSLEYLRLHKIKSNLSSKKAILELILECIKEKKASNITEFEKFVVETFDWEVYQQIKKDSEEIFSIINKVEEKIKDWTEDIKTIKKTGDRKSQAKEIIFRYPNHKSFLFCLLDGKELTIEDKKKLYEGKLFPDKNLTKKSHKDKNMKDLSIES